MRYSCVCGKLFNTPKALNGHRSHCFSYLQLTHREGVVEKLKYSLKKNSIKGNQKKQENKLKALTTWISEQHTCEKCGKIMTEKFGSGRFCSRACANSRCRSEESKTKTSVSLKQNLERRSLKLSLFARSQYAKASKVCPICGNIIPYEHRNRIYCSDVCENIYRSNKAKENHLGGITKGHGSGIGGKYKGIRCDSRYELAYVIYCLDHNIKIERNKKFFTYQSYDGKEHKYYPDFILKDGTYVEIKGYHQQNTKYKIDAMNNQKIKFKILYWSDLKYCLNYIKKEYKISYYSLERLYDN